MKKIVSGVICGLCLVLAGCSSAEQAQSETPAHSQAKESSQLSEKDQTPMIIDVRTPEEFATGHVTGAVNFDVNDAKFQNQVKDLDKSAAYVLYCRSGHRAEGAKGYMESIGFTDVKNLGSVQEASQELGLDVVVDK
ncbi:rhodanese-like domain-containing protein [Arcanobacterium buesumense]|uniref:Rhodanese-like domain-containing protein n=2 Tax=Arcanobacterium buesumense TaxID=2722751 RepID=A0A6H2ENS0_9ACTO|nr:rhodanese-like domain-containing protein [Arcanobacterium buesumense]